MKHLLLVTLLLIAPQTAGAIEWDKDFNSALKDSLTR